MFITSRVWLIVVSIHKSFTWLGLHQSKAAWHLRGVVLSLNPEHRIQHMFRRSGLCFSFSRSRFHNAHSVTLCTFSLHPRVKRLTQLSFSSLVFSLLIFHALWLSWWRLRSFEAILARRPARLHPYTRADFLYLGSNSGDNQCWLLVGRPERLRWLPGLLPSLSLALAIVSSNHCLSSGKELTCSSFSVFHYFWLKAAVINCWYFCVVSTQDQLSVL